MSHIKLRRGKKRRTAGSSATGAQNVVYRVRRPHQEKGEITSGVTV